MSETPSDKNYKDEVAGFLKSLVKEYAPPLPGWRNLKRKERFAIAMFALGIAAVVTGAYPVAIDAAGRHILWAGGWLYVAVGVWELHRTGRTEQ